MCVTSLSLCVWRIFRAIMSAEAEPTKRPTMMMRVPLMISLLCRVSVVRATENNNRTHHASALFSVFMVRAVMVRDDDCVFGRCAAASENWIDNLAARQIDRAIEARARFEQSRVLDVGCAL